MSLIATVMLLLIGGLFLTLFGDRYQLRMRRMLAPPSRRRALPARVATAERPLLEAWLDAELRALGAQPSASPPLTGPLAARVEGLELTFEVGDDVATVLARFARPLGASFRLVPNRDQPAPFRLPTGVAHFDDTFVLFSTDRAARGLLTAARRVALIELFPDPEVLVRVDGDAVTLALPSVASADGDEASWRLALRERLAQLGRTLEVFEPRAARPPVPRPVAGSGDPLAFLPEPSLEVAFEPLELAAPGGGLLRLTLEGDAVCVSPWGLRLALDERFAAQLSWASDARGEPRLHLELRQASGCGGDWHRLALCSTTRSLAGPVHGVPQLAREGLLVPEDAMLALLARVRGAMQAQGLPERWID